MMVSMLASPASRKPESFDELISPQLCAALDRLDLRSAKLFSGKLQGERRSKARGRSVEFEDYRQYVAGDDLRHVDWNVLARLDKFFIKIFQEEQDLALHVAIDASPSMDAGTPNKLVFAQKMAMALGYLGLVNNNRVMVTIFGTGSGRQGVRRLEAVRSSRNVQRLASFLLSETFVPAAHSDDGVAGGSVTFSRVMKTIAGQRAGRGVLVLLSDLLIPEGYRDGLALIGQMVQGGGWDVTLAQVLSPGELDPLKETDGSGNPVALGDLRLSDVETGRACEVTLTRELVRAYQARLDKYQGDLHAFASARGMSHAVLASDSDVTRIMLEEFRRRGVVE
jgi:hypothetical protein